LVKIILVINFAGIVVSLALSKPNHLLEVNRCLFHPPWAFPVHSLPIK
jgi:hypothetical protein